MAEKVEENNIQLAENTEPTPEPIEKLTKKKYKYPYDPNKNKEYKQRSKQKKLIETKVEELVKNKLDKIEAPAPVKEKVEAPKIEKNEPVIQQEYITKEKYKKLKYKMKNKINNLENDINDLVQSSNLGVKKSYVYNKLFS